MAAQVRPVEDSAVKLFEERMLRARPVSLSNVRVLGGPLKLAQDADAKYLLELSEKEAHRTQDQPAFHPAAQMVRATVQLYESV